MKDEDAEGCKDGSEMHQSGAGSDEDSDVLPIESDESISGDSDRERPVTRRQPRAQLKAHAASVSGIKCRPDDNSYDPVECSSEDSMEVDERRGKLHLGVPCKLHCAEPTAAHVIAVPCSSLLHISAANILSSFICNLI